MGDRVPPWAKSPGLPPGRGCPILRPLLDEVWGLRKRLWSRRPDWGRTQSIAATYPGRVGSYERWRAGNLRWRAGNLKERSGRGRVSRLGGSSRSEEHTSEL